MATPAEDKRLADTTGEVTRLLTARRDNAIPSEFTQARIIAEFLDSFYIATDPEDRSGLYVSCNYCTRLGNEWVGTSADGIDVAKVLFDHFIEEHLDA